MEGRRRFPRWSCSAGDDGFRLDCKPVGPTADLLATPLQMDGYRRVNKPVELNLAENELRVTSAGKSRTYVAQAVSLLTEKGHASVIVKGLGKAINKTVIVGE